MRQGTINVVIASGQSVSPDIDLRAGRIVSISVPLSSGDMLFQGNVDSSSSGYARLLDTRLPGSGDLRFATNAGSRMIMWPQMLPTPPYGRIEMANAVIAPSTFIVRFSSAPFAQ